MTRFNPDPGFVNNLSPRVRDAVQRRDAAIRSLETAGFKVAHRSEPSSSLERVIKHVSLESPTGDSAMVIIVEVLGELLVNVQITYPCHPSPGTP